MVFFGKFVGILWIFVDLVEICRLFYISWEKLENFHLLMAIIGRVVAVETLLDTSGMNARWSCETS